MPQSVANFVQKLFALYLYVRCVSDTSRRQDIRHVKACHANPVVGHPVIDVEAVRRVAAAVSELVWSGHDSLSAYSDPDHYGKCGAPQRFGIPVCSTPFADARSGSERANGTFSSLVRRTDFCNRIRRIPASLYFLFGSERVLQFGGKNE